MKIKTALSKGKRRELSPAAAKRGDPLWVTRADLILLEPQFLLDELLIREEEGILHRITAGDPSMWRACRIS